MQVPAPIRVVHIEAGSPLPEISPLRPDGARYAAALVFVRRNGVPVGRRRIGLGARPLSPAELVAHLDGLLDGVGPERAAHPPADDAPFISVVVPSAMQRPGQLLHCVERLAGLDYPAFEVIVVDNRPEQTAERLELHNELTRDPHVRVVCESLPGSSAARNRGIATARGGIIAFTDDDIEVDDGWLAAIAHRFQTEPETDCVTGHVFPAELETLPQIWFENSGSTIGKEYAVVSYERTGHDRYSVLSRRGDDRGRQGSATDDERVAIYRGIFGGSGNMAVRAEVFARLGGFDEALGAGTLARGGEDLEFISRLLHSGGLLTADPAVMVSHRHRDDYAGLRAQMYGYGVGYTAALTALVASDIRHIAGIARLAGAVVPVARGRKQLRVPAEYPSKLRWIERWGLVTGPFAYIRSRRAMRRGRKALKRANRAFPQAEVVT